MSDEEPRTTAQMLDELDSYAEKLGTTAVAYAANLRRSAPNDRILAAIVSGFKQQAAEGEATTMTTPLTRMIDLLQETNRRNAEQRDVLVTVLADGRMTVAGRPCRVTLEWEDPTDAEGFGGMSPAAVLRRSREAT